MASRAFDLYDSAINSPTSKQIYRYSLHEFMRFVNIKKYDDLAKLDSEQAQEHLENWLRHLADKDITSRTIYTKLVAVELFFDMNKISLYKKILRKMLPSSDHIPGGNLPFTTEDIQKFLKFTLRPRTTALVLFLASTGTRPASITDPVLLLKHIEDMPQGCKSVRVYDGSKEGYWAFLTPEASNALKDYLNSRKRKGEKLGPESPVFANFDKPNPQKKNDYMSIKSLRHIMQNLIKASGIERKKIGNRYDKAPVYGFRKRFNTILKLDNNVNSNIAEKLMAHKRGLDGVYFTPTREECFIEFLKAIPKLTISDESRNKLKIKKLEQETSEIERLSEEVKKLREWVDPTLDRRIALESDPVTGEIPFDLPNIPRYSLLNFKKSLKDPNYMKRISGQKNY